MKQVEMTHYNPMREGLRVEMPNVMAFNPNPHSTLSESRMWALARTLPTRIGGCRG